MLRTAGQGAEHLGKTGKLEKLEKQENKKNRTDGLGASEATVFSIGEKTILFYSLLFSKERAALLSLMRKEPLSSL